MATDRKPNRFAVTLDELEHESHTAPEERVEEIGKDPNPDVVSEERRRLETLLKTGGQG